MHVILLLDRPAGGLQLLARHRPVPLLPIVGRALVEHSLESLAALEVDEVSVVTRAEDATTRAFLEETQWPGLRCSQVPGPMLRAVVASLVVRGDMLRAPNLVASAVEHLRRGSSVDHLLYAGIAFVPAGRLLPTWHDVAAAGERWPGGWGPLGVATMRSVVDYFDLVLAGAGGRLTGLHPAGWPTIDGIRAGCRSRIETRRAVGRAVEVGEDAWVGPEVRLKRHVVVGDRATIGRGASLENAVVLPDTFVGPNLDIKDAIVAGPLLHRPREGITLDVADRCVLDDIRPPQVRLAARPLLSQACFLR